MCGGEWERIVSVVVLFRRFLINDGYFERGSNEKKEDNQKKASWYVEWVEEKWIDRIHFIWVLRKVYKNDE